MKKLGYIIMWILAIINLVLAVVYADGQTKKSAEKTRETTIYNDKGEVDGVKYSHITTVLVNSVKEQQTQIETQKTENQKMQNQIKQQLEIDALKSLVCADNKTAAICQPNK